MGYYQSSHKWPKQIPSSASCRPQKRRRDVFFFCLRASTPHRTIHVQEEGVNQGGGGSFCSLKTPNYQESLSWDWGLGLDLTSLPTLCICMVSAVWHETSSQCSSLQQGVKLVRKCKTISNSIYTLLCYVTKYSKRLFSTIQAENQKLLCENCFLLVNNNTMKFT